MRIYKLTKESKRQYLTDEEYWQVFDACIDEQSRGLIKKYRPISDEIWWHIEQEREFLITAATDKSVEEYITLWSEIFRKLEKLLQGQKNTESQ